MPHYFVNAKASSNPNPATSTITTHVRTYISRPKMRSRSKGVWKTIHLLKLKYNTTWETTWIIFYEFYSIILFHCFDMLVHVFIYPLNVLLSSVYICMQTCHCWDLQWGHKMDSKSVKETKTHISFPWKKLPIVPSSCKKWHVHSTMNNFKTHHRFAGMSCLAIHISISSDQGSLGNFFMRFISLMLIIYISYV